MKFDQVEIRNTALDEGVALEELWKLRMGLKS